MSLLVPDTTRYDVNFHLLGFPIRIHPGFWLIHCVLAAALAHGFTVTAGVGPTLVFLMAFVCTAGSVLLHELGHVLAGRRVGADGEVILTILGGVAGTGIEAHSRKHRILVTLAGPAVNLGLAVAAGVGLWAVMSSIWGDVDIYGMDPDENLSLAGFAWSLVGHFLLLLLCVNVPMAVWNLIPVPPLDGWQVAREVVDWYRGYDQPPWHRDADWWKRG